jgi:hypothetical protein
MKQSEAVSCEIQELKSVHPMRDKTIINSEVRPAVPLEDIFTTDET